MMDIRPIRTEDDYNRALEEFESYFDKEPAPESDEGDRFELLGVLLRDYEGRHWPVGAPGDPVEVLHFAIDSMGRSQAELGDLLGSRPRASEILSRKRALTVELIDKISTAWRIPAELLAKPYRLGKAVPLNRRAKTKAAKQLSTGAAKKKAAARKSHKMQDSPGSRLTTCDRSTSGMVSPSGRRATSSTRKHRSPRT